MGSFTFSKEKEAPEDVTSKRGFGANVYSDLIKFIDSQAVVGEWIKIDVSEENRNKLDKLIHSMQTSIRSWRSHQLKYGKANIELQQYKKYTAETKAEIWIKILKFDRK